MKYVRLGRTNLIVSRVAFGTWELGGEWGSTDADAAIAAIRRAADGGVNLFDTAQAYGFGASEELLAAALKGRPRHEFVIATKGGLRREGAGIVRDSSAEWIRAGVEASLTALSTDYIDLYQVHWPDPATPFAETAAALKDLVAEGKVRHVGVSNFSVAQMDEFSAALPVQSLQPPYHIFRRDIEAEVLPYTRAHDIGVLVYGPLGHGLLGGNLTLETRFAANDWRAESPVFRGEAYATNLRKVAELKAFAEGELGITLSQLAVAWALSHPGVDVAIVGTRSPAHVDEALAAGDLELDGPTMARIVPIIRDVLPVGGPSPERARPVM